MTTDEAYRFKQSASKLWISYKKLSETVEEGSLLLVDDGLLGLKVKSKKGTDILCTVQNNATLGEYYAVCFCIINLLLLKDVLIY